MGAESLGIPLPGETALITAGIYAGHTHRLSPWLIFAVASAAAIIGDNIGYWIGDKGGYPLARRYRPRARLDQRKLKITRYMFDNYGAKVVFFGRFVLVLRTYAAFLAGVSRMRWRRFLPANAADGILWAAIHTTAAYLAGDALQRVSATITWVLAGVGCGAIDTRDALTSSKPGSASNPAVGTSRTAPVTSASRTMALSRAATVWVSPPRRSVSPGRSTGYRAIRPRTPWWPTPPWRSPAPGCPGQRRAASGGTA